MTLIDTAAVMLSFGAGIVVGVVLREHDVLTYQQIKAGGRRLFQQRRCYRTTQAAAQQQTK